MTNRIKVTFRTRDYDGMIFYNGVGPPPQMGDFIFAAIDKGEITLGYNLGSGFTKITSPIFVADDNWHTFEIVR